MNEFTDQNSCKRTEELVSYLYGEASQSEKSRFEDHLVNCSSCAAELADFAMARSLIVEWRDAEFQPLAVPAIQLPVRKIDFTPEISGSRSLPAQIRALFSLSPAWAGAGAAAALVICVGLLLVAINYQRQSETAQVGNDTKVETLPSPVKRETAELQTAISAGAKEAVSEKSSEPPIAETKGIKLKDESVAVKVSQSAAVKNKKTAADKTTKSTKPVLKKSNQAPPPTLMADEDEYEDNSLRLSDIFRGVKDGEFQ